MPKVSSGAIVSGLTTAALAVVGVLAWQASAAPDHVPSARPPHASPGTGHASHGPSAAQRARVLPAASGSGRRIVYAPGRHRVWLVGTDGATARTYEVAPGTVAPLAGTYKVTGRTASITGSDGTQVGHIVYFAMFQSVSIAFDAAADGSFPTPDPAKRTGAIREHVADAAALWTFAPVGTKVVVVP